MGFEGFEIRSHAYIVPYTSHNISEQIDKHVVNLHDVDWMHKVSLCILLKGQTMATTMKVLTGKELIDIPRHLEATAGLYKKNGDPARSAEVAEHVLTYLQTRLPEIMIDRRHPDVLAVDAEEDD